MNILFLDFQKPNTYFDAIYNIMKDIPTLKCTKQHTFTTDSYDMYILNENSKIQTTKPCILLITTNPFVQDMSSFVYNVSNTLLDLHKNISTIWLIDIYKQYKEYLEVLYKVRVEIVPFSYIPKQIDFIKKPKQKKLDIVLYDSNKTFNDSTLKSLYICNEFYLKHPELLGTVFLFNMPENKVAYSMLESFDIWKTKKMRIFKNIDDQTIVRYFKNSPNYSVFLSNTNLETIPSLMFDISFNDIPILHTQSVFEYGIVYDKNDIDECLKYLAAFETLKNTNTINGLDEYTQACKSIFYKLIFGKEMLSDSIITKSVKDLNDLSRPLVITYDNDPKENTYFYLKTLEKNNWDYILIGKDETWQGWPTRMRAYQTILKTIHPDKIVVLTDARDVVCCRSANAFMDAFASFRSDMVVSMELFCENQIDPPEDFISTKGIFIQNYWKYHAMEIPKRKFVNNGLICGKASKLYDELKYGLDNKFTDDQKALSVYVNTFPQSIGVDYNTELFHTTCFGAFAGLLDINLQKRDSPTFAELFGRSAFFLHIPGQLNIKGAKTLYSIVKSLLEAGVSDELFRNGYPFEEPQWIPNKPISVQGQTLGAYYQCYKHPGSFIRAMESFQRSYPESTIVVSNDGGDDFSNYCKHIKTNHVHYTYYPKTTPPSKQLAYRTIEPLLDFLKRLWDSFPKFKESHIVLLEDDVRVIRRHTMKFTNTINGMNPKYELFQPMKDILKAKGYKGHFYLGGCGGCVLDKQFYERISFQDVEALLRSVPPIPVYASDVSLVFIALYYGGSINNYDEFAEMFYPNVAELLVDNKVAFMHQVKYDYDKPLLEDDTKKIKY
jgi:hypothetical protein